MTTQQVDEGNTIHHQIKTRKQIVHIQCKFKNPRTSKNCPYAIICSFWSCVSFNLSHGSAWAKRTKELPDKVRCGSRRCCHSSIKTTASAKQGPLSPILGQSLLLRRVWLGTQSGSCAGARVSPPPRSLPHLPWKVQAASLTSVTVSAWKASKSSWPGQSQPQQQYGRFGEAWVLKVLK